RLAAQHQVAGERRLALLDRAVFAQAAEREEDAIRVDHRDLAGVLERDGHRQPAQLERAAAHGDQLVAARQRVALADVIRDLLYGAQAVAGVRVPRRPVRRALVARAVTDGQEQDRRRDGGHADA